MTRERTDPTEQRDTEAMMNEKLLEILACPVCKGDLLYDRKAKELICKPDQLAYPIRDDIPVLLVEQARKLQKV